LLFEHVERADCGVYWLVLDDEWEVTAASCSFQSEVLSVHDPLTSNFLETVAPGMSDHIVRRAARDELVGTNVELIHQVRTGARAVLYTFRKHDQGWMLFGRDRSEQLELVAQMSALIEDLDVEMKAERASSNQLRSELSNDHLTGLASRRHLEEVLEGRWEAFVASQKHFAVIMIDIDEFKGVNDRYGHDVGDEVLKGVSEAISGSVCDHDTASRQGGDEFVVVANHSTLADAERIGERIRTRVHTSPITGGSGGRVSVSIGVASTDPAAPGSVQKLLKWADMALLRAKEDGRNCVCAYSPPKA
jgi:diguanylate cyclase (GGDEF)-like protein